MSTHLLPVEVVLDGPVNLNAIVRACQRHIGRTPLVVETAPPFTLTFTPDLSATEIDTLARIVAVLTSPLFSAPDDYAAIMAQVPTLRAYFLEPSPTNAQSVAAIKSIIIVLRALIRD